MRNIVFENHDHKAIRVLLKEVGKYRYDRELEQKGYDQQPPLVMSGFFLEANDDCTFLCYKYPSRTVRKLMKVDQFTQIPKEGWNRKILS